MGVDNYLAFSLKNGAQGDQPEWGSEDFEFFPAKVKEKPLEDVLSDKLGHIEIVKNGFSNPIETILYNHFVIYNGGDGGVGLYLYDIKNSHSYLLNDRGDFESAIFYNNFNEKDEKLYIKVGMEISSMPKICIYDLKKLDNFVQEKGDKIKDYLTESINSQFPNLYDITNQEKVVYCTFDDGKYYYGLELIGNDKIRYTTCEDDLCKYKNFEGGKIYESDWNGENKQFIKIINNSRKTAILCGLGILALGGIIYGVARHKKKQK